MEVSYAGDPIEDRPEADVRRFENTEPVSHQISKTGSNAEHTVWQYRPPENAKYFDLCQLIKLEPGEYTDFHSHREEVEGRMESVFQVFEGKAEIRTEYWDQTLERFDIVRVPPNAAYQIGNGGTETLWVGYWASRGEESLNPISLDQPASKTGAQEEYDRIMAAREEEGLPARDVSYTSNPDQDRPQPSVTRFATSEPVPFSYSPEVGGNASRLDWINVFPDVKYITTCGVVRLEPGTYISFHSHEEMDVPYEEVYWVVEGKLRLQTEYWDTDLEKFDWGHFEAGCAHRVGNIGTEPAWFIPWAARGGDRDEESQGVFDVTEPSERESVREEFKRIMAARKQRGLPLPPNVRVASRTNS